MQFVYFAFVEEQFARPLWFMIEAVSMAEFRNIGVYQPNLIIANFGIALGN